MKVFGLVFLCIVTITGLPTTSRSPLEPDDCSKECINGVVQYGHELSILKYSDLSNYFNKIDEICEVIITARKCLDKCGAAKNPFALDSLNIVCQPQTQEKIGTIKQCMHYIDSNINEICSKECSNDHIIDETDVTPKMNPMIQKANGDCANFKCMARCNVEVVSQQCGKEVGKEFQGLLQEVMDTQRKDLENLKLVDTMAKTSPPECNYLYDPSVLFGGKPQEQTQSPSTTSDPKEDAKSLYAQAQLQLLIKQIELTEKQDQLIDRENAKLDMEMAYMAHKAEQRYQAHALPTFVPMEKMPKEHMPMMEPLPSHPHQMEATQQESRPQMEMEHPQEPNHPEQMPEEEETRQQPMEQSQPSMESHPPMDFPHPMPMETIPEEPSHPKHHQMPRQPMPPMGQPVIIDGMPMEFVPMERIHMEMPMQNPMEAMPRFL